MSLVEKLKIRIYARISSVFKFKYELHSNIVELVENYVRIQRITRMIFSIEIIFCLREIKTYLWVHYLGEYHISIWLRIFLRSNNRRYHERAHCHWLVHVKVHRFVVAKCVKSANGSESEPSSRFIANVIEILKRHFAYIQILPCSVSPLTISLSLSLGRNELTNGKINRWISKIPCLPIIFESRANYSKRSSSKFNRETFRNPYTKKKRQQNIFKFSQQRAPGHSSINLSPQ